MKFNTNKWLSADVLHPSMLDRGLARDKLYQYFKVCKKPADQFIEIPSQKLIEDFNLLSLVPTRK
jgi:hypothetical protein